MSLAPEDIRGGAEPPPAALPVPTPCIGVCWLDEATGLCQGCARTSEEVAAWQAADNAYKRSVWDALPERRARTGMATYRLPWSAEEIAGFIERSLRQRGGRWVLGLDGASVSFAIAEGEEAEIVSQPDAVVAITDRGILRLTTHPKTIAIAFGAPLSRRPGLEPGPNPALNGPQQWAPAQGRGDEKGAVGAGVPQAIGLVLPRGRVDVRRGDRIAKVGPDAAALAASADAQLYDLGVALSAASRLCLRTADPALIAALDRLEGRNWREALAETAPLIRSAHLDYVVETGLGRAESLAANAELRTDAASFPELPHGWTLPAVFAPCAFFYPYNPRPADALLDGDF